MAALRAPPREKSPSADHWRERRLACRSLVHVRAWRDGAAPCDRGRRRQVSRLTLKQERCHGETYVGRRRQTRCGGRYGRGERLKVRSQESGVGDQGWKSAAAKLPRSSDEGGRSREA